MLENVLTQRLNPKYQEKGFTLGEDEDFVTITRHGKIIARFYAKSVTFDAIETYIQSEILINQVANEEL